MNKRRSLWVDPILTSRLEHGEYHHLMRDLLFFFFLKEISTITTVSQDSPRLPTFKIQDLFVPREICLGTERLPHGNTYNQNAGTDIKCMMRRLSRCLRRPAGLFASRWKWIIRCVNHVWRVRLILMVSWKFEDVIELFCDFVVVSVAATAF